MQPTGVAQEGMATADVLPEVIVVWEVVTDVDQEDLVAKAMKKVKIILKSVVKEMRTTKKQAHQEKGYLVDGVSVGATADRVTVLGISIVPVKTPKVRRFLVRNPTWKVTSIRRREKIINLVELAEVYVMAFADEAALGLVLVGIMDVDAEPALTMDPDKNHPKEFRKMVPVRAVEDTVDVLSEDDVVVAVVEPGLVLERGLKERSKGSP